MEEAASPLNKNFFTQFSFFNKKNFYLIYSLIIILILFLIILFFLNSKLNFLNFSKKPSLQTKTLELKKFSSEAEFKDYIVKGQDRGFEGELRFGINTSQRTFQDLATPDIGITSKEFELTRPDRFSQTNVQVRNIDEPDIAKTDGKNIYFSTNSPGLIPPIIPLGERPGVIEQKIYPSQIIARTKVINSFPISDIRVASSIDRTGEMILSENILVIFSNQEILGYDISNPSSPLEKWKINIEDNNFVVNSRLYNNKLYLITQNSLNITSPCPITPLSTQGSKIVIPCSEIYHPGIEVLTNAIFNVFIIDPQNGEVSKKISLTGSYDNTQIYMSEQNLFLSFYFTADLSEFMYKFFQEKAQDLTPGNVLIKLEDLQKLTISKQAKQLEMQVILQSWQNSLNKDEALKVANEIANRLKQFSQDNIKELEKTAIFKLNLDNLETKSTGQIPGRLLNQFSLDEYQNNLRVATTLGGGLGVAESSNEVYVLNERLDIKSSVGSLGLQERIYSVRFIEDRGYLVTFKQIDPFYILDLSNPSSIKMTGELKIPGFSSYLDPLKPGRILGVGQEGSQVKLSLFDVSDSSNPTEVSKYNLNEFWSEVSNNHHAFLHDKNYQVFFIPGGKGGYIFSYQGDKLTLKKAVNDNLVKRAIYIDDYMYILSENKMVVLDEKNWGVVKELSF